MINRIGVHEPRHDLFVRAHVRPHDVGVRTDEGDHFLHVAPRDAFQFGARKFCRIDRDAAFRSAVGQIRERALPTHPHGERGGLAHRERGRETRAAFCRPEREMMLHAITLKRARAAVVHVNRQRHRDGALRIHKALAIVLIDTQIIGDDLELIAGHLEHFVVVNVHWAKVGS